MKTFEEVKQQLLQIKPRLQQFYQVTELGIFGSYARQEQTETSDVDVLIDYVQTPTLFKLVELREDLSEVLGMKVDVVTKNGLKPSIRERVLSEVVYL
ncbi:MAG TPA: nucleotidyltransferase family protein [Allocoleopsis sp.]